MSKKDYIYLDNRNNHDYQHHYNDNSVMGMLLTIVAIFVGLINLIIIFRVAINYFTAKYGETHVELKSREPLVVPNE